MQKLFFLLSLLIIPSLAAAQDAYLEEAEALGYVAGQGLVCGSEKYDTFELLARAIILTKSPSDAAQTKALYTFNDKKASVYFTKKLDGLYNCTEIVQSFDNQDIFKATLYKDGTIKMPDGKILTPRVPYDSTQIYRKDEKLREKLDKAYAKNSNYKIKKVNIRPVELKQSRYKEKKTQNSTEIKHLSGQH